jgi:glycosyltransferase involved in cell wall biosynthesis
MRREAGSAFASSTSSLTGKTILQIVPRLDAGDAEGATIDVAAALAAEGAVAVVAAEGGRSVSELQARGGVWLPFPAGAKNPLTMTFNAWRLARLLRDERVDLVHARSRAAAWVALRAARMTGVPFVTTYHGAYAGRSALKLLYNSVMARGDAVIANSHWTSARILSQHPRAAGRIRVIPRGVDFGRFAPEVVDPARVGALRAQWGCAPEERIILVAARLTAWKGHRVLIEAMKRLADRGMTDVAAVFAGDDRERSDYVKELEAAARAAGLGGRVRRVGYCADMPAALLAASALVAPSTEPEAFGRAAVEAQAMGTPTVASDLGAVGETILAPPTAPERERTGWCIPPNDPEALAEALYEALSLGASAREGLSLRARRHVRAHYSLEGMCAQTLEVYRRVLEFHSGEPPM